MTPKEKAKELFEKFITLVETRSDRMNIYDADAAKKRAKECAVICINEILKICPLDYFKDFDPENSFIPEENSELFSEFWEQVKAEIENLNP